MKLTDSVFEWIINWNRGGPKAAKILNDVVQRKLYTFLGGFTGVNDVSIQYTGDKYLCTYYFKKMNS